MMMMMERKAPQVRGWRLGLLDLRVEGLVFRSS